MVESIKISCIIPTCRQHALINAVDSALKQSLGPLDIIIINNGKDEIKLSDDILRKVKVYNAGFRIGASAARNLGAKITKGNYLAFLDDDDSWNENYLENAIVAIRQGAECVFSRMDYIENGQTKLFKNPANLNIKSLLTFNPGISGSNIVISRDSFFKAGGYDENLITSEDKSLTIELLKIGARIKTLPENQVIIKYNSAGLRSANNMAQGIYLFTKKYKKLMTLKQYVYNWYKIYYYRYKAGIKSAFLPYILLTLFFAPKNMFMFNKIRSL